MHWVTRVKPPLGFEPGLPAWEADNLPSELSLPSYSIDINITSIISHVYKSPLHFQILLLCAWIRPYLWHILIIVELHIITLRVEILIWHVKSMLILTSKLILLWKPLLAPLVWIEIMDVCYLFCLHNCVCTIYIFCFMAPVRLKEWSHVVQT